MTTVPPTRFVFARTVNSPGSIGPPRISAAAPHSASGRHCRAINNVTPTAPQASSHWKRKCVNNSANHHQRPASPPSHGSNGSAASVHQSVHQSVRSVPDASSVRDAAVRRAGRSCHTGSGFASAVVKSHRQASLSSTRTLPVR